MNKKVSTNDLNCANKNNIFQKNYRFDNLEETIHPFKCSINQVKSTFDFSVGSRILVQSFLIERSDFCNFLVKKTITATLQSLRSKILATKYLSDPARTLISYLGGNDFQSSLVIASLAQK